MRLLDQFSIQKRLWANLLIVVAFLAAVVLISRYALVDVRQNAQELEKIQETQSAKIAEFQTHFSNTLLKMNDYTRTLDEESGEAFNRQMDELKKLNLSQNPSRQTETPETEKAALAATSAASDQAAPASKEKAADSVTDAAEEQAKAKATTASELTKAEKAKAKAVKEMDYLLTNIKKSANSSVFLKTQIQETLEYGIEPTAETLKNQAESLGQLEGLEPETYDNLKAVLERLNASQIALVKMLSVNDPSLKSVFHKTGLGDSSNPIFEQLNEQFAGDFLNADAFGEFYTAWEGYYESFSDLSDYIRTSAKNNDTITELTQRANQLLQQATQQADQQTLGLINSLSDLSDHKTVDVSALGIAALFILMLLNSLIIKSISAPLSAMKKQVMNIAQNGTYQNWQVPKGNNELTEMGHSISALLSSVNTANAEIRTVSQQLADGNLTAKMTGDYRGDLNELKEAFNNSLEQVVRTFSAIDQASLNLAEGNLKADINLNSFQGDYLSVMENLHMAMGVQKEAIEAIIGVMAAMSQGDFNQRITRDLPGEYTRLKHYLNDSLESLEHSIDTKNQILDNYKQGDFSFSTDVQFNGKLNELKSNMDRMAFSISEMLNTVQQASRDAVQGVEEISAGNQDLNERVQNQAAALQRTTQSMESMAQSVSQSLQQAGEVNKVSHGVKESIQKGSNVVVEMGEAMQAIFEASQEISNITEVIDSIAFQTNLLALNAAVEAARAGESGRGFAVVASEVRSLAQKSADAAKQIRDVSESSISKVERGLKLSEETTATFVANQHAVEQVSNMISEMHSSLQKQTHGIQEVSHALNDIDDTTQQNAAMVEEISTTSANIIEQVRLLEESMKTFTILDMNTSKVANDTTELPLSLPDRMA